MHIQVKLTKKKRGIVLYDPYGGVHVCTDAQSLWRSVCDLDDRPGEATVVPDAVLLQLKFHASQIQVLDEDGEIVVCTNAYEFYECICEALGASFHQQLVIVPQAVAVGEQPQTINVDEPSAAQDEPPGEYERREDGIMAGIVSSYFEHDAVGDAFVKGVRRLREVSLRNVTKRRVRRSRRRRGGA